MTGIMCALLGVTGGGFTASMTVGSGNYIVIGDTYRWRGYISTSSFYFNQFAISGGSMSSTSFKGRTILNMSWQSDANSTTSGTVVIEFNGDVTGTPGFVTDATVNGVSVGGSSSPTYYASTDTTNFTLGSGGVSNPFTIGGTDTITLV